MNSLKAKETFELVVYPENGQVLPLKWVFTYKFDEAGYLIRYKARLCVRGDFQHYNGDDIYTATGAYRSFRILMALVCAFGLFVIKLTLRTPSSMQTWTKRSTLLAHQGMVSQEKCGNCSKHFMVCENRLNCGSTNSPRSFKAWDLNIAQMNLAFSLIIRHILLYFST